MMVYALQVSPPEGYGPYIEGVYSTLEKAYAAMEAVQHDYRENYPRWRPPEFATLSFFLDDIDDDKSTENI